MGDEGERRLNAIRRVAGNKRWQRKTKMGGGEMDFLASLSFLFFFCVVYVKLRHGSKYFFIFVGILVNNEKLVHFGDWGSFFGHLC